MGQNKIDFVWFLLKDWCHYQGHLQRISGKEIYITIEREAYKIREINGSIQYIRVSELCSTQEEADIQIRY